MIKIICEKINNRRNEYEDYLTQHISAVQDVYKKLFKDLLLTESDLTIEELTQLEFNIENHDASKYTDEEFYPYLYWFYPSEAGIKSRESFDYACLHHYHYNPHHWNHWVLNDDENKNNDKVLDMPEIYVIEMLCDWSSFKSKNPESTAHFWYTNNKDKMNLTDNTRALIEKYLELCPEL